MRSGVMTLVWGLVLCGAPATTSAQEGVELFAGGLGGVSALSADTTSTASADDFRVSFYAPGNGLAVNVFAGAHLTEYLTVQANYLWNRNHLRFETAGAVGGTAAHGAVRAASSQHGVVGDLLVYFRERRSRLRPYLSLGFGMFRIESRPEPTAETPPELVTTATFTSTTPVVRVAVGLDVPLADRWSLRYTFSEGISPNPIGDRLEPPGERVLMNFQNLVGLLVAF